MRLPRSMAGVVLPGWRVTLACALGGTALFALTVWALSTLPSPNEFHYVGFWPLADPLPFAAFSGITPWQLSSHLARLVLLGPAVVLLGVALARVRVRLPGRNAIVLASMLLVLVSALFVIRGIALHDDDATYLMQAVPLSQGHLFSPTVPDEARWFEPFTLFTRFGTSGKYLFGEPLLLAVGMRLGWPSLGPVLLALFTLLAVFEQSRRETDEQLASLGLLLFALSPMFVFTSPTALSEVPALLGVALAVLGLSLPPLSGGAVSAVGLGIAFVSRPQVALPCAVALLLSRRWEARRFLAGIAAGAPFLVAVLLYDRALSGSALLLPWFISNGERMGFGYPTGGPLHYTPLKGLGQLGIALIRFNGWGLGWPVSLLGPLLYFFRGRPRWKWIKPWALVALTTFVFQYFYYTIGPSETGPLYHYAALPFVAFSTAAVIESLWTSRYEAIIRGVLLASLVFGTGSFLVEHALRLHRLTDAIVAPYQDLGLPSRALLIVDIAPHYPNIGWCFGVPFRTRRATDAVVVYPDAGQAQWQYLRALWSDRPCYYLTLDAREQRTVGSCDDAERLKAERVARDATGPRWVKAVDTQPPRLRWQDAFRWVPWL